MPSAIATAYGPPWNSMQGFGTTATGIDLHGAPHDLIVAVDPSLVPLGSKLKIWPNPFGDPNLIFTAADTGGAIKGAHFDFYDWRGRAAQVGWGVKNVTYRIVGRGSPANAAVLGGRPSSAASPAGGKQAGAQPSTDGGGWASGLGGVFLRGFLELAFVAGGAALVGVGASRAANSTPAGRQAIAVGKRVARTTAAAGAKAAAA